MLSVSPEDQRHNMMAMKVINRFGSNSQHNQEVRTQKFQ